MFAIHGGAAEKQVAELPPAARFRDVFLAKKDDRVQEQAVVIREVPGFDTCGNALENINYQTGELNGPGLSYLWFRIPMQILFMVWVYFSAIRG